MSNRKRVGGARRWVIKIGSALITNDGRALAREAISGWVAQMAALRERGTEVVLVSSGAVAEGMRRLGWASRPKAVHELQAAAAALDPTARTNTAAHAPPPSPIRSSQTNVSSAPGGWPDTWVIHESGWWSRMRSENDCSM